MSVKKRVALLRSKFSPIRLWAAIFAVWTFFLTGALASVGGSPGMLQALQLKSLLEERRGRLEKLQKEMDGLEHERDRLEKSASAQEYEIRRVLGYAGRDEMIFEFAEAQGQ